MKNEYLRPQINISAFSRDNILTESTAAQKLNAQTKAEKVFADEGITEFVGLDW